MTSPTWIETLRAHPDVQDAEAFVAPDSGQRSVVVVPAVSRLPAHFRTVAREVAPADDAPTQVLLADAVDRVDGGLDMDRIGRRLTLDQFVSRYEPARTDAEAAVVELLAVVQPNYRPSMTDDLMALGADSIVAVELAQVVSDRFGVEVDAADLFAAPSLREIAVMVFPAS